VTKARSITAVLHAHSTWSYDGHWTLDSIARLFGRLGIDAVLMTEHDTGFDPAEFQVYRQACAVASTPRCSLIPGIEYSCPNNDVHVLTWGVDRFLGEHRPVIETLKEVQEDGGVSIFAHPKRRNAWSLFEEDWVPYLNGIEAWNRKTDGIAPGEEALRLQRQTGLLSTAGLDFHRSRQIYPLNNRIEVSDGPDFEDSIVDAIRRKCLVPRAFGRNIFDDIGEVPRGLRRIFNASESVRSALTKLRSP